MQNTILFIDDEPSVLEALEWTFADEPYRCITCQDPFHALEIMSETDVAVVVSDQRMPGMNGADFFGGGQVQMAGNRAHHDDGLPGT
jgi:DNA-binding NtrC family response regulator